MTSAFESSCSKPMSKPAGEPTCFQDLLLLCPRSTRRRRPGQPPSGRLRLSMTFVLFSIACLARGHGRVRLALPGAGSHPPGRACAHLRRPTRRDVRRATLRVTHHLTVSCVMTRQPTSPAPRLRGYADALPSPRHAADEPPRRRPVRSRRDRRGADDPITETEPTRLSDGVAQRNRPVVLEKDQGGGRIIRDVLENVPGKLVREHLHFPRSAAASAPNDRADLDALFAFDTQADQRATLLPSSIASSFDRSLDASPRSRRLRPCRPRASRSPARCRSP